MNILRSGEPLRIERPTVATIGFFDGVHLGHRHLIAEVCAKAAATDAASAVVTFDIHPRQVLQPAFAPQLLSTPEEKIALLADTGVDYCCVLHFTRELAELSASDFMRTVLYEQFHVRTLITGYDNRFGHNRSEGFADYVRHGARMGMEVIQSSPFTVDGIRVSSSVVRRCLAQGDVTTASRCLGRPYTIEAPVVSGQQEGRRMGFRTANIDTAAIGKMLPRGGVYATGVRIDGMGEWLPAMTNIGTRPTFGGVGVTVETNILDFSADVYGHRLQVAFCHWLRDERRFADEHELARQLCNDENRVRQLLK